MLENAGLGDVDKPAPGSPVSLLPVAHSGLWLGEMRSWTTSASGLVITSEVLTTAEAARVLDGQRVWVSARTRGSDSLLVFEAVARAAVSRKGLLVLSGVVSIASERRRRAVRAPEAVPVTVVVEDETRVMSLTTVDLSSGGCRVTLEGAHDLAPADSVRVTIDLGSLGRVETTSDVLRVDGRPAEAVLRFRNLTSADRARLDRVVLQRVTARSRQP